MQRIESEPNRNSLVPFSCRTPGGSGWQPFISNFREIFTEKKTTNWKQIFARISNITCIPFAIKILIKTLYIIFEINLIRLNYIIYFNIFLIPLEIRPERLGLPKCRVPSLPPYKMVWGHLQNGSTHGGCCLQNGGPRVPHLPSNIKYFGLT